MAPRDKPLLLERLDGSLAADLVAFIQKDTDRAVAAKEKREARKKAQATERSKTP